MTPSKAAREFDARTPTFPKDLDAFAKPLVEMLENLEFAHDDWCCPECGAHPPMSGHKSDCALAHLLEDHGREVRWRT